MTETDKQETREPLDIQKFKQLINDKGSYPYIFVKGINGDKGMLKTRHVPAKYSDCYMDNLPIQEVNPTAYKVIKQYTDNLYKYVEQGTGLFLFSQPSVENKFGTGTGKTQSAITVLNHYLAERCMDHLTGKQKIEDNPVYFCKATELQTIFNSQFRGSYSQQEQASNRYYKIKERVKNVELLVLDDIATRATSEAYTEELYEIIDHRATNDLTTVYTSNIPLSELPKLLGDRIASRIEGMTVPVPYKGKDHRKKGL